MIFVKAPTDSTNAHYERRGERATEKVASTIAQKSWRWTLINIAWTAGPVTFIALQVGYYMGFGKGAPLQNFIYFAGYTVVAAVLAVLSSVLYDALYKPRVQEEQKQLLRSVDDLHCFMLHLRDAILRELEPHERRIISAYYLLSAASPPPSAIGTAVMDLTGSAPITKAARNIHAYTLQGLYSCAEDTWEEIQPELEKVRTELSDVAPQTLGLLERFLQGDMPSLQTGIERTNGFIDRVLCSAEENTTELMTLGDAHEMATLCFELLNGRRIAVLDVSFKGNKAITEAQQALEGARQEYRIALRNRNSFIRLLANSLATETDLSLITEALDNTQLMLHSIEVGLRALPAKERASYEEAYKRILNRNQTVILRREKLLRAEAKYAELWRKQKDKLALAMQSSDLKRSGFFVEERSIFLTDKQKLKLAKKLGELLHDDPYPPIERSTMIVMEIANLLDDMLDISQPEEERAIESSNAGNFGSITTDLSASTKAGWATLCIDALHENRRKASHRIAYMLVSYYRIPLTESMMDLFVETFGAERDYLESINEDTSTIAMAAERALPAPAPTLKSWMQLHS